MEKSTIIARTLLRPETKKCRVFRCEVPPKRTTSKLSQLKTTTRILIFIGLVMFGGIIFLCFSLNKSLQPRPQPTPSPISNSLKKSLCTKLDNSHTESICSNDDAVLATDTFGLFEKNFTPHVTTQDDIVRLLGSEPAKWREVDPFFIYYTYRQFDLTGTGVNRIVTWSDHNNIVKSVVLIRPDVFMPLSRDTVVDLCIRLDLTGAEPCIGNAVVYTQDFFPTIKERFLGKQSNATLFSALEPYTYIEPPHYEKLFFNYDDNIHSSVLFYFDESKKLEDLVFIGSWLATPLDREVLTDLCQKLHIDMENAKCKTNAITYSTDLKEEVRAAFPIGIATYEDVQNALAKYQYRFDYPIEDTKGGAATLSWYDFVGNHYTTIKFEFDNEFIVRQIQFFSGGS